MEFIGGKTNSENIRIKSLKDLHLIDSAYSKMSEMEKIKILEQIRPEVQSKLDKIFQEYSGIGECLEITIDDTAKLISNYKIRSISQSLGADKTLEEKTEEYQINKNVPDFEDLNNLRTIMNSSKHYIELFGNYAVWKSGHSLFFTKDINLIEEVINSTKLIIEENINSLKKQILAEQANVQNLEDLEQPLFYYKTQENESIEPNDIDIGKALQSNKITKLS